MATVATVLVIGCVEDPAQPADGTRAFVTVADPSGSIILTLGGATNAAFGVNDNGVIVGESERSDGSKGAFRWTAGSGTEDLMPTLGNSRAHDVNASGLIVGAVLTGGELRAYRLAPSGSPELLPSLTAGNGAEAFAVNASNVTVGLSVNASSQFEGVRWDESGNVSGLGTLGGNTSIALDVNDAGVIVGESKNSANQTRAFKWTSAGGIQALPMPSGSISSASAINNAGYIAGYIDSQPVVWRPNGSVITLPSLGGTGGLATDINDSNEVVGESRDASGVPRAFAWDSVNGISAVSSGEGIAAAISANRIVGSVVLSGTARAAHWQIVQDSLTIQFAVESGDSLAAWPSFTGDSLHVRDTTVVFNIGVVNSSGQRVPNRVVVLQVVAFDSTGGHVHALAGFPKLPGGIIRSDTMIVLTDTILTADTAVKRTYRTSQISGTVAVRASSPSIPGGSFQQGVVVRVPGLVQLDHAHASVDTFGTTTSHPVNNWGRPEMVAAIRELADSLALMADTSPSNPRRWRRDAGQRFPSVLAVNDMSCRTEGCLT